MIPTRQEIAYRVFGAWLLARFDAGGAQYFDVSPQAALRSFFAAVLVVPAHFITKLLAISGAELETDEDPLLIALVFALGYTLLWAAPAVILYRICQAIDRESAFFRFLSANNWSSVISTHLQFAVTLVVAGGIAPEVLGPLLSVVTFVYLIMYQWFLTRHSLDVTPLAAVGLVAVYFVIAVLIDNIAIGMVYRQPS